ncbi:MAG: SAM-dependent methyltransferase, partial [Nitrospirae bacterium]
MIRYFCRYCNSELKHTFVDLSSSPLANSYLKEEQLNQYEPFYPLHVFICDSCFLVQLPELEKAEHIFSDYAYFSSFSESWLNHAKQYVDMVIKRFGINEKHFIIEIASNDGYLLQYFQEKHIPVLGIEPASNVAEAAIKKGIPTLIKFFNTDTAN